MKPDGDVDKPNVELRKSKESEISKSNRSVSPALTAKGRVVAVSRSQILAESSLFDRSGRLVAHGNGAFARSRIPKTVLVSRMMSKPAHSRL